MVAATTATCIVSIPRLNAKTPAIRSHRSRPRSPSVEANANP